MKKLNHEDRKKYSKKREDPFLSMRKIKFLGGQASHPRRKQEPHRDKTKRRQGIADHFHEFLDKDEFDFYKTPSEASEVKEHARLPF